MLNMIRELVVKYELDKDRNINRKHKVWVKIRTDICKRTNINYKLAQLTKKWDNFKKLVSVQYVISGLKIFGLLEVTTIKFIRIIHGQDNYLK